MIHYIIFKVTPSWCEFLSMLRNIKLRIVILSFPLLACLASCSGGGSGGEASVFVPKSEGIESASPKTYVIKNSQDSEAIQSALDAVSPGDKIIIRAGSNSFSSDYRLAGESLRGFTLSTSGTAEKPIYIIGESSENEGRPVIDQGKTASHDSNRDGENLEPTAGLYLQCVSHVVIENLEIRNTHLAGITSSLGGCKSSNITIVNSHIHHVYGDRNVAGIRMSGVSDITIKNNELHDIYQVNSDQLSPVFFSTIEPVQNVEIENNQFSDIHTGIRLEGQNDKSLSALTIKSNHFERLTTAIKGVIRSTDDETMATGRILQLNISDNLLINLMQGVDIDAGDSQSQSETLRLYNNTFYNIDDVAISLSAISSAELYNNIFSHISRDLLISRAPVNTSLTHTFSLYDHNLYWAADYDNATGPEWLLDLGGSDQQLFVSMDSWKIAYTSTAHQQLNSDPDQDSTFTNPLFVDAGNNDFRPTASLALSGGRQGHALGAFRDGNVPGIQTLNE